MRAPGLQENMTMRDSDVRAALRRRLEIQHAGDDNTLDVEQMGIWSGSVRIYYSYQW